MSGEDTASYADSILIYNHNNGIIRNHCTSPNSISIQTTVNDSVNSIQCISKARLWIIFISWDTIFSCIIRSKHCIHSKCTCRRIHWDIGLPCCSYQIQGCLRISTTIFLRIGSVFCAVGKQSEERDAGHCRQQYSCSRFHFIFVQICRCSPRF